MSESSAPAATTEAAAAAPSDTTPTDKGYPESTPLAEMTDAERAAYWKDQNKHTDRLRKTLAGFKGTTPEDVEAMRQELEQLRSQSPSETPDSDDGDPADALEAARAEARAEAENELIPLLRQAQLKSAAALVLRESDQLSAFLAVANPEAFIGDDGCIDDDKVMGHLTALFAVQSAPQPTPGYPSWGQHSGGTPPVRPGEAGKAEAAKRFGF